MWLTGTIKKLEIYMHAANFLYWYGTNIIRPKRFPFVTSLAEQSPMLFFHKNLPLLNFFKALDHQQTCLLSFYNKSKSYVLVCWHSNKKTL